MFTVKCITSWCCIYPVPLQLKEKLLNSKTS